MRTLTIVVLASLMFAFSAGAEPTTCQKQVIRSLLKFKKTYLKALVKCVDAENLGKIPGPCPDVVADAKIDKVQTSVREKIGASCPGSDLATLGFPRHLRI
jgi:hypothetical protein